MKKRFVISLCFGLLWLILSAILSIHWIYNIDYIFSIYYLWWIIIGIALLPGFLMSSMFFSNMLNRKKPFYPKTKEPVTVLLCAHNEQDAITDSINAILQQDYAGYIRLLVIDNASTDQTRQKILQLQQIPITKRSIKYIYCEQLGKAFALNTGLEDIDTAYFITVDADTHLEKHAIQRIMNHIVANHSACTAGNLFVQNATESLTTRMQNYDYLLSIAAVKRFQGSYQSTLVAQGAFSAYRTQDVRKIGGWQNVLGEDIVLTYQLLQQGLSSTYEPRAVAYTTVPATMSHLYNQRKRWAIGMLEGLSFVHPWQQPKAYSKYFTMVNLTVIYLDLAFLFGFIPGVILAFFGYYYLVGLLTLFSLLVSAILFYSVYLFQKRLNVPFQNSISGFICFLLFFQTIQSIAAVHGYMIRLCHRKGSWK